MVKDHEKELQKQEDANFDVVCDLQQKVQNIDIKHVQAQLETDKKHKKQIEEKK